MKMLTNKNKKSSSYSTSYLGVSSTTRPSTSTSNSSTSKPNTGSSNVSSSALSELEQRLRDYGLFKYDGNGRHAKVVNVFPWTNYENHTSGKHKVKIIAGPDDFLQTYKNLIGISPFGKIAGTDCEQYITVSETTNVQGYKVFEISVDAKILTVAGIRTEENNSSIIMNLDLNGVYLVETERGSLTIDSNSASTNFLVPLANESEIEVKDGIAFEYFYDYFPPASVNSYIEVILHAKATFDENIVSVSPNSLIPTTITGKTVEFNYPGGDLIFDGEIARYEVRKNFLFGYEFLIDTTTKRYLIRFLNTKTNVKPIGE